MANIAFFEIEKWEIDYIKKALKKHKLSFSDKALTVKSASKIKNADIVAVFIYSPVDKKILDKLPNVKMITTMSTGFDHIDLKECEKRGITVCNVPTYGANTVAEHTFALILNITRKVGDSFDRTRKGDFSLDGLRGFDLKDKTIGIVGCGNIGQHVARMAKGFEMNVLVCDVKKHPKLAKKLGFKQVSLKTLLKKSDIITLHVPENKSTHHMIDSKAFRMMKKGVVLINTARGGLIDTNALVKALNNKTVSAAGLDVLEGECLIKEEKQLLNKIHFAKACDLKTVLADNMLLKKPNVYITPHNAFNSREALLRIVDTTVDNINRFLKKKPVNKIKIRG